MRALLGLLVLGGLFLTAATWQGRTTAHTVDRRAHDLGAPADIATRAGWSRLVLGRPSGAPPLARPSGDLPPTGGIEPVEIPPPAPDDVEPPAPSPYARDFEYVVRSGQSLGIICQNYYGSGNLTRLVPAVARYNDIDDPDSIRAGDVLLLPDEALLLSD